MVHTHTSVRILGTEELTVAAPSRSCRAPTPNAALRRGAPHGCLKT